MTTNRILKLMWYFKNFKKCIFCDLKFSGGILSKKHAKQYTPTFINLLKPEYLFHCKSTHGYDPEILGLIFKGEVFSDHR